MWVFSRQNRSFDKVLKGYVKRRDLSFRALAKEANSIGGAVPEWSHLEDETVRSWLRGKVKTPRNWQHLAASAQALGLYEDEAAQLFRSTAAQWTIEQLRELASEHEVGLLTFPKHEIVPVNTTIEAAQQGADNALVPRQSEVIEFVEAKRQKSTFRQLAPWAAGLVVAGVAVAGVVLWPSSDEPGEPTETEPAAAAILVGQSCDIDLSVVPFGPVFALGVPPENCPNLQLQNQYENYDESELVAWDQSIVHCWAAPNLAHLWIRFQMPDGQGPGWFDLDPHDVSANARFEDNPPERVFDLRAEPDTTSPVLDSFAYSQLEGTADRLRLDLPAEPNPKATTPQGSHHLAACWQESSIDDGLGLHFFWNANP